MSREVLFLKGKNSSPPSMILNGKILSNIPYSWQRDHRMQKGGGIHQKDYLKRGGERSELHLQPMAGDSGNPTFPFSERGTFVVPARCGDGGGPTTDCSSPLESLFELLEIIWIFSENKLSYLEISQCDQEEDFSEKQ